MASELEVAIQQHLLEYLAGVTQLHEFEDWFVPISWELAESDDVAARELVGRIHNLIAETSRGDRSIESMHEELMKVLHPPFAENDCKETPSPSSASNAEMATFNVAA